MMANDRLELLSQGAEARVFATEFCGRPAVVKERFPKKYRLPALDQKLTKARTLQEVRCHVKVRCAGVDTPCIYMVDSDASRIYMERLCGLTVKQWLRENMKAKPERALRIAQAIGAAVALIHDAGVIHGDLTTSNFMLRGAWGGGDGGNGDGGGGVSSSGGDASSGGGTSGKVGGDNNGGLAVEQKREAGGELRHLSPPSFGAAGASSGTLLPRPAAAAAMAETDRPPLVVIDFGLGLTKPLPEDKAVDLYVLERAFVSTHAGSEPLVAEAMRAYEATSRDAKATLNRLANVRKRGRKRDMFG